MAMAEKIIWYRTPLDKDTLKGLTQRSDLQGFCRIVPLILTVAATGGLAYYAWLHWSWPVVVATVYLYGTLQKFITLTGPGHELSHYTVFKTRFWNDFFLRIISFLTWTNYSVFRKSHARHHQYTTYRELDGEVVLPMRVPASDWLFWFTIDPKETYRLLRETATLSLGITENPWHQEILPESDVQERRQAFRWARIMLFGHLLLAGVFIYFGQWILLVLVTFGVSYARWLGVLVNHAQHLCMQPNVPDFRLCARSIRVNPVLRFFYCNMNYHVEHHMFAAVPFYNLPKLHKAIKHDLPPAGSSLWAVWKELLPAIRRQKQDPNYHVPVKLPMRTHRQ